ncbi:MAG: thiamine pyrophosphate-dependent enzyme [Myxococcota bacterium]
MYGLKSDWLEELNPCYFTLEDYEGSVARWCPGCGDHAVLTAVQRVCRDEQLPPEKTVVVSGIGCSSRFPHYMGTYGFHGLHGRALPVACGIRARRPDLHMFVTTGDGDNCSIGAGHWVHAIRYNMNMSVLLFDNNVYGLTKNQTSPTSSQGQVSNTHPRGAWLRPIDPIATTLSITNASFVAQVPDWNPALLYKVLLMAHRHEGLGFVRILQRCPHYTPKLWDPLQKDPGNMLLMTHPDGLEEDDVLKRLFPNRVEHDPTDMSEARDLAAHPDLTPVGIFYRNEDVDRYDQYTVEGLATPRDEKLEAVRRELDRYAV